jgi:hypothetical protein
MRLKDPRKIVGPDGEPTIEWRDIMPGHSLFAPVLHPLLRDRKLLLIVTAVAFLQLGLTGFGLPGWQCPFFEVLGIPCPGCGLTRGTLLLLKGHWYAAISLHAFAPMLLLGLVCAGCSIALPDSYRLRFLGTLETLEVRTGFATLLLIGLILYWLARLLIMKSAFVQLVQG